MAVPILPLSYAEMDRFWRFVDMRGPDECWPWKGYCNKKGYGRFRAAKPRRLIHAHRVSFALTNNYDPGDLNVLHSCDFPPCCNGKHLFDGTAQDNVDDMIQKGRYKHADAKGENNGRAVLTIKDVEQIQRLILQRFTNIEIGKYFGVTHSMISAIRRGKAWGVNTPLTAKYESMRLLSI